MFKLSSRSAKLLFWSLELLIIATLIFVGTKINFLFQPIGTLFTTMFAPIIISGFLFYCVNPLVEFMINRGIKRIWAIIIVFLILIGTIVLLFMQIIPTLITQLAMLMGSLPDFYKSIEQFIAEISQNPRLQMFDIQSYLDDFASSLPRLARTAVSGFSNGIGSIISSVAGILVIALTVPFILFYMLKDGEKLLPAMAKFFPETHREGISNLLIKMSRTVSKYISGQMIECLFVAVGTSIGYSIIGIQYAFLFGVIAGLTNLIPYIGPYIGLAPAVFSTVFTEPWTAVFACVVVLIVQQIDSNIIYPNVIGKTLDIHPLTIIIILLFAGNLAGLLGMILGVPLYAVCKTIFSHIYEIIQLNTQIKSDESKKLQ